MKDRIKQIMEAQHMNQQVFADFIGITPATLSGIFNDRTRPTINIVESIKKKLPALNTDWLLFGHGNMYVDTADSSGTSAPPSGSSRTSTQRYNESTLDFDDAVSPTPSTSGQPRSNAMATRNMNGYGREEIRLPERPRRHVTEIRVYYDDQTWESFVPSKK
ncbi:MAG: helix-turn-helix transcriptional regulator [Prevotella sp.]|jgi:transcriptional regulator with XRE-family HTH domain|nr:helix-turn-helix transcriptional regulator [Prevotella sp.]